jgi:NADH dehydrogenase/NADH:ubiquinone oxidoreductase subunit G
LGDEAAPLPSTQALPDIAKGQDIEAFTKIKEVELQDAVNVIGTSVGAEGHTLSHRSRRQRLVKIRQVQCSNQLATIPSGNEGMERQEGGAENLRRGRLSSLMESKWAGCMRSQKNQGVAPTFYNNKILPI